MAKILNDLSVADIDAIDLSNTWLAHDEDKATDITTRSSVYSVIDKAAPRQKDDGSKTGATNIDLSKRAHRKFTLTGNITLTFSNPTEATRVILVIVQDPTGGRTIDWSGVSIAGSTDPTIDTSPNAVTVVEFYFDGTNYIPLLASSVNDGLLSAGDWVRFNANAAFTPEAYGAVGDGVADDTNEVIACFAAAAAATKIVHLPNQYRVTSTVTLSGDRAYMFGPGGFVGDEDWDAFPLLTVSATNSVVENITILETNASPLNVNKSSSQNIGLRVSGAGNVIRRVKVDGFGYCLELRDTAASGARDNNTIEHCEFSNARNWGVEVDSCQHISLSHCKSHTNGYDGFKVQNEYSRTCDYFSMYRCEAYNNGRRDTAAGGADSTNGNGIDLFQGGFKFDITACVFHSNYGSGIVLKGNDPQPEQGHGSIVSCYFDDNLSTSGGVSHGVELGTNFTNTPSWTSFTGCYFRGNTGNGVQQNGGTGVTFHQCKAIDNGQDGFSIRSDAYRTTLSSCHALGNNGNYAISFGDTNDGTWISRHHVLRDSVVSGAYDPNVTDNNDIESGVTESKQQYGIRIFSDCADIDIHNTTITNIYTYALDNRGKRVVVDGCTFTEVPRHGVYNTVAGAEVDVKNCLFKNLLQVIAYTSGNGTEPSVGDAVSGSSSSATGTIARLTTGSGSWAGGDAAGTVWLKQTTGVFSTGVDTLNYPAATTSSCDSMDKPYCIRILFGIGRVHNNEFIAETLRTDAEAIYVDGGNEDFVHSGNRHTNFNRLIEIEAAAFLKQQDLIVNDFGTVADGTTDDQPAIQRVMQYAEDGLIGNIVFKPGTYGIGANIVLPDPGSSSVKKINIIGGGAVLQTIANDVTIFDRTIASQGAGTSVPTFDISGFSLRGQASNTYSAGIGMDLHCFHNLKVHNCDFQNLYMATQFLWCMDSIAERLHAQGCLIPWAVVGGGESMTLDEASFDLGNDILETDNSHGLINGQKVQFTTTGSLPGGLSLATDYYAEVLSNTTFAVSLTRGGSRVNITSTGTDSSVDGSRITGATSTNANSNGFTLRSCRTQITHADAVGLYVHNSGGFRLENSVIEGSLGKTAVDIFANAERRHILLDQLWIETTDLTTAIKADIYRSIVKQIGTKVPSRSTGPDETFYDDTGSRDSVHIISECDFYNWNGAGSAAWFINQSRAAGDKNAWLFRDNVMHPSTPDLSDASLWAVDPATSILLKGETVVRGTRFETF